MFVPESIVVREYQIFPKYLPFLVQHQLPEGILKLEQPLHADEDSAEVSDTPHQHAQAMKFSQNALRQAVVADKVDNKLDVRNYIVDVVDITEGLQKQVKTVCSTPQAHDAGELSMTAKSLYIKVETQFFADIHQV